MVLIIIQFLLDEIIISGEITSDFRQNKHEYMQIHYLEFQLKIIQVIHDDHEITILMEYLLVDQIHHIDGMMQMIEIYGDEKVNQQIKLIQIRINNDHVQKDTMYLVHMNGQLLVIYSRNGKQQKNEWHIVILFMPLIHEFNFVCQQRQECLLLVTVTTRRHQLTLRVLTPSTGRLLPLALVPHTTCARILLRLIHRIETTVRTGLPYAALEILAP